MMENMIESEIDIDEMSISSEFSIIPDSMVHGSEENVVPNHISMNVSFRRSEALTDSATSSVTANPIFNKVHFGTLQRVQGTAKSPQGSFIAVFCCDHEFNMTKLDRIGMYKVGFSSPKDYLCFVWVPVPSAKLDSLTDLSLSSKNTPIAVKFEGSCLPKEEEESYQLCYLMHDGSIAGVSVPFQLKIFETSEEEEIENTARHVLSIRVQGLVQEQRDLRDSIQDLEIVCNHLRCENEELSENLQEAQKEKQSSNAHSEELEKQVDKLHSELDKINAETVNKDEQIKNLQMSLVETHSKLTATIQTVNSLEERLEAAVEERKVSEERNGVIMQDNVELKICLQHVKEDLDQALKEKEAAEKIAIDLSQRLQTTHDDHETLTKGNKILLAKLNGILMEKSIEESLNIGGWHCVPKENEYDDKEASEEVESCAQTSREEAEADSLMKSVAPSMVASVSPSVMASVCHSSCSQNTKELAESFSQKMEVIVSQLTLQKEQINSIKEEIEKTRHQSRSVSVESQPSEIITEDPTEFITEKSTEVITEESSEVITEGPIEIITKVSTEIIAEVPNIANMETHDAVGSLSHISLSDSSKEAKIIKDVCSNTPDDDKKVLYGHSFLPTCCTAPVFFPYPVTKQPPRSTLPSAPSSISMGINEDYSILTTDGHQQNNSVTQVESNYSQTPSPQILNNHSQTPPPSHTILENDIQNSSSQQSRAITSTSEDFLPPPLLPETTATARNAAVLNQYINESTMANSLQNVESNSQVTGNIGETTTEHGSMGMLSCPMCHLSFEENGIGLLQEHIDSHLERVCPVCSTAFTRNTKQEEFEFHVHKHFQDEEEQSRSLSDPSGQWGQRHNTNRSFHLLEID